MISVHWSRWPMTDMIRRCSWCASGVAAAPTSSA